VCRSCSALCRLAAIKPGLGFLACPSVTVFAEALQAFVLFYVFVYRRKLYESWWPGWSLSHITKRRMIAFLKLYVPARCRWRRTFGASA
jgi:hypothetical protein